MNNKFVECIKNSFSEGLSDASKIDFLLDIYNISPKDIFMRFNFKEFDIVNRLRERSIINNEENIYELFHIQNIGCFTVDLNDSLDKLLMDEYNLTALELHKMKRLDQELFNIMEDYFYASVNNFMHQNHSLKMEGVEEQVFETLIYEYDDKIKEFIREVNNEALKSCPLCKNKVDIYFNADSQYIECPKCGLKTKTFVSEKDLVKYWNERD